MQHLDHLFADLKYFALGVKKACLVSKYHNIISLTIRALHEDLNLDPQTFKEWAIGFCAPITQELVDRVRRIRGATDQ